MSDKPNLEVEVKYFIKDKNGKIRESGTIKDKKVKYDRNKPKRNS